MGESIVAEHRRPEKFDRRDASKAVPYSGTNDLRRGIVFYAGDKVVSTMYFDQFAQGSVNAVPVQFSGFLLDWVETQIPPNYR